MALGVLILSVNPRLLLGEICDSLGNNAYFRSEMINQDVSYTDRNYKFFSKNAKEGKKNGINIFHQPPYGIYVPVLCPTKEESISTRRIGTNQTFPVKVR